MTLTFADLEEAFDSWGTMKKDKRIKWHIETRKISELKPYDKNPRIITEYGLNELGKSFDEIGMAQPININTDGTILSGHARWMKLKDEGELEVDCYVPDRKLTPKQEEAVIIRMNKNIAGEWSWEVLANEWDKEDLIEWGFKEEEFGVAPEVEVLPGAENEDDVPEVKEAPVTRSGDIWLVGRHRVKCGDSTMIDDVDKLMAGEKADMVFTSPPYNGDTHLDYGKGQNKKLYENSTDKWSEEEYIDFCRKALGNAFLTTKGFIFWNVNYNAKSRYQFIECIYPYVKNLWETICWKKRGTPIPSGLTRDFEFVFCFKNGERKHLSEKFKTESNHWEINNIGSQNKESHRACFPVALPEKGIFIASEEGQIVLDLFLGSGSTLIACEKTNRTCYGMEIDPWYVDVCIERYMNFTGKDDVILESTGEKYTDLKGQRQAK